MRLIAVGDIHGQLAKLEQLLEQVRPVDSDRWVFLGDYIDRGPDSAGVIAALIAFARQYSQSVFLRGNHEQMMLDANASMGHLPVWKRLQDQSLVWAREIRHFTDEGIWLRAGNGARAFWESYGLLDLSEGETEKVRQGGYLPWHLIPEDHVEFLKSTVLWHRWHRQGDFLFVHTGTRESAERENPHTLLWGRYSPPGLGEIHVVGHTPTPDGLPFFEPGRINLDTGAGNGGPLTACDILTGQFWQTGGSGVE